MSDVCQTCCSSCEEEYLHFRTKTSYNFAKSIVWRGEILYQAKALITNTVHTINIAINFCSPSASTYLFSLSPSSAHLSPL